MASIDNLRAKQYSVAAFTNNKMGLRARVLENCGGPQYSKEILKNSSLASPLLFGEVPESFVKRLESFLTFRDSYLIRPTALSTPVKRAPLSLS